LEDNSCYFDKFIYIFLHSLKLILELDRNINLFNKTRMNNKKVCLFIEFINNKNFNEEIIFFDAYINFNKKNK